jgi:hypothetical protein
MRVPRLAFALAALAAVALAPAVADAQTPSRRLGSFEFGAWNWYPDLDAGSTPFLPTAGPEGQGPWEQTFGGGRRWGFRAGLSRTLLAGFGTLDLGVRTGYLEASAKGFQNDAPAGQPPIWVRSGDSTAFRVIPTSVTLTYRFDYFAERFNVPLAPYVRAALERYNWWITDGAGKTSQKGATNGWSATAGMALLLDFFDPQLARDLDRESGVNHTYLYFDVTKSYVDDFGSSKSWDLSDEKFSYSGGLLFVF